MDENEYYKNPKYCLECGKILPFEKRFNKFCNRSCSNTYTNKHRKHSQETKDKISKSLKRDKVSICKYCGSEFFVERRLNGEFKGTKYCCKECHDKSIKEQHHNLRMKEIKEGTFIGWKTRNITSYAEKFWELYT